MGLIMPKWLESKLKKQYGMKSAIPYKVMNSMGAMHGSKETELGKDMESKHRQRLRKKLKATRREDDIDK